MVVQRPLEAFILVRVQVPQPNINFIMKIEELISEYIAQAQLQGECTVSGDHKKGNEAHDKLRFVYTEIKKSDPELNSLFPLLKHNNDSVRSWTAYYLLPKDELLALSILDRLGDEEGVIAFGAKVTAAEWRKGILKIY